MSATSKSCNPWIMVICPNICPVVVSCEDMKPFFLHLYFLMHHCVVSDRKKTANSSQRRCVFILAPCRPPSIRQVLYLCVLVFDFVFFFLAFLGLYWQDRWRYDRKATRTKGPQAGTLQRGHRLCIWDGHSTNWAKWCPHVFCSKRRRTDDYSFQLCDRVPGSRRHIAVLHGAAFADQDTSEGNNEVKLILSLRLKQVSGIPSYIRLQTL